MRTEKEFEEYVRELGKKKLVEKQKRIQRAAKVSPLIGGCAAACVCAVIAVFVANHKNNIGNGVVSNTYDAYKASDKSDLVLSGTVATVGVVGDAAGNFGSSGGQGSGQHGENEPGTSVGANGDENGAEGTETIGAGETEVNGDANGGGNGEGVAEATGAGETEASGGGAGAGETETTDPETENAAFEKPDAVIIYIDGKKLKARGIKEVDSITDALNRMSLSAINDAKDSPCVLKLEFEYANEHGEGTFIYTFTENSVIISQNGEDRVYKTDAEEVAELLELIKKMTENAFGGEWEGI